MSTLLNQTITTAVAAQVGPVLQLKDGPCETMAIQGAFTYGSGGTNATLWAQTSLDGGLTWSDVACLQFSTASARTILNLSALTVVSTPLTPGDGALAANSSISGLLGSHWRVKYTTTGTYAGGTALRVDLQPSRGKLTSLI